MPNIRESIKKTTLASGGTIKPTIPANKPNIIMSSKIGITIKFANNELIDNWLKYQAIIGCENNNADIVTATDILAKFKALLLLISKHNLHSLENKLILLNLVKNFLIAGAKYINPAVAVNDS